MIISQRLILKRFVIAVSLLFFLFLFLFLFNVSYLRELFFFLFSNVSPLRKLLLSLLFFNVLSSRDLVLLLFSLSLSVFFSLNVILSRIAIVITLSQRLIHPRVAIVFIMFQHLMPKAINCDNHQKHPRECAANRRKGHVRDNLGHARIQRQVVVADGRIAAVCVEHERCHRVRLARRLRFWLEGRRSAAGHGFFVLRQLPDTQVAGHERHEPVHQGEAGRRGYR